MDSSIPPGPRAIDSKPSVTCENGNTHITDQHNYQHQHSIAKNDHSLCDSSPTDINGNTTTDAVSPSSHSNVLLSVSSTTPASLQGPPTIQKISMLMHAIATTTTTTANSRNCNMNTSKSLLWILNSIASSTSLFQLVAVSDQEESTWWTNIVYHIMAHTTTYVITFHIFEKWFIFSIFIPSYTPESYIFLNSTADGAGSMKFAHLSVVMERSHVHVEIYYAIMITRHFAEDRWTSRTYLNTIILK